MVDVPLHITNPPAIVQNVRVQGGTNWDLSRSAVPTPIQQLPDPEPIVPAAPATVNWVAEPPATPKSRIVGYGARDGIPATTPTVYEFGADKSKVLKADARKLRALSKKVRYVVAGHASETEAAPVKLAWARANHVAAALRASGHKVALVKAFGNDKPRSDAEADNRRVEVYPAGASK